MRSIRVLPDGPAAVRLLWTLAALAIPVFLVALAMGDAGTEFVQTWLLAATLALATAVCAWRAISVRAERAVWGLMAAAVGTWAAAEIVNGAWISHLDPVPYPSLADALWLADYPFSIAALALLLRRQSGRVTAAFWLDGAMGAVAALAVVLVAVGGLTAEGGTGAEIIVNAAYPVGDLLLCAALAGVFAVGAFPMRGRWLLLAVSFAAQVIADASYLQQVAEGTERMGALTDLGWYVTPVALAAAAWRPTSRAVGGRWRSLLVGSTSGVAAVTLLVVDHFHRLPTATVVLGALAIALVLVRLGLVFRAHQGLLDRANADARTDALTGLGNRRALLGDLEDLVDGRGVLALFDLDGFKAYNDLFGHPAGDELLSRLGARIAEVAAFAGARAYRLGGDEFCLLAECDPARGDALAEAGRRALCEAGDGFKVGASGGWTRLPAEGVAAALADADRRMYAVKHGGRPSAARQTAGVLLAAVSERHPDLGDHVGEVADRAVEVARTLGLSDSDVELTRMAAELHDVGKIAIPDAILNKPAKLDENEMRFMRRHTIIGERIMLAAPDLKGAAPLVRASHERWDGGGYPDGLAGEAIPLGARIVAVCDAFDAIVAERPYRPARTAEEALAELRRCAGGQFDPSVVEAFVAVLAAHTTAA